MSDKLPTKAKIGIVCVACGLLTILFAAIAVKYNEPQNAIYGVLALPGIISIIVGFALFANAAGSLTFVSSDKGDC